MNMVTDKTKQPHEEETHFYGNMETVITLLKNYWYWYYLKAQILYGNYNTEFRLLIYIFLGLSILPISAFVLFCTCLSSFVFFIATGVWLFFSAIAFFVLLPFLIGSLCMAIALVLVYQVYVYLMAPTTSIRQNKDED